MLGYCFIMCLSSCIKFVLVIVSLTEDGIFGSDPMVTLWLFVVVL